MVSVYMTEVTNLSDPLDEPGIMKGLPKMRKEKILRYRQLKDRKLSLGASLLLEEVLTRHGKNLDCMKYGEHGKPEMEGIYFNLSHSHDYAVCVVSSQPVGCDIEKIERKTKAETVARRFFTDKEISYLMSQTEEKRLQEFFRIWTMKESYLKMTGEGMSCELNRVEFVFGTEVEIYRDGQKCSCTMKEYEIPDYKLTVCGQEKEFAEDISCIVFD